jgi:ubiquinone/menaquinone biosynthesis C-methylase UbiE
VVDVGGGRGLLLAGVLAANPRCHGVLYEQPEVIASADRWLQEAGVGDRCELVSGDFFESVPAGGDVYLLSHVIHNWDDAHAERVLANCCRAMTPDGRVVLVEALMPSKVELSPLVKLMDLNMLLLCGGRQRTEAELAELLERAGLELARVVPAGGSSVVEAVRTTTEPQKRASDGSHLT